MTIVVGVRWKGTVIIGADSAGTADYQLVVRQDRKVFEVGPYVLGFCGSFRMGQLLAHAFKPAPPPRRGRDLERFMVVDFVDGLRAALKTGGWARTTNGQEEGGIFLVGVRGRLFHVEADYQVGEPRDDYDAVGSGADVARGALFAGRSFKPMHRVRLALRAAERHNAGCRGPFHILTGGMR